MRDTKTFNSFLARAKKYIKYEEKLTASMEIYGGSYEHAKLEKRAIEEPKHNTGWRKKIKNNAYKGEKIEANPLPSIRTTHL